VEAYKDISHFKVGKLHPYIQAKRDLDQQWLTTRYRLTESEVGQIIEDWEDEWKTLMPEIENLDTQLWENDPKEQEE